jgi:O-antigen/teichoic acid export membrane protein
MAIGLGRVEMVALAPFIGSLVNLPLSYYLTTRLGVAGVVWGTVLTTSIANLLVPGIYLFRFLGVRPSTFLVRTLFAPLLGTAMMVPAVWICQRFVPPDPVGSALFARTLPLALNLAVGTAAYAFGYCAASTGRSDVLLVVRKMGVRPASAG